MVSVSLNLVLLLALGQFLVVEQGYLAEREAELVGGFGYTPELIAQLVGLLQSLIRGAWVGDYVGHFAVTDALGACLASWPTCMAAAWMVRSCMSLRWSSGRS